MADVRILDAAREGHPFDVKYRPNSSTLVFRTEGTILTVAREVAAAAMKESESATELRPFLEQIAAVARASVEKTPTLLAVLREAGVVDSGGTGLQFILEGIADVPSVAASRGAVEAERRGAGTPSDTPRPSAPLPVSEVPAPTEFGYETVFILSSPERPLDLAAIREAQLLIADGHHRYESAVEFGAERGGARIMALVVPAHDVSVPRDVRRPGR